MGPGGGEEGGCAKALFGHVAIIDEKLECFLGLSFSFSFFLSRFFFFHSIYRTRLVFYCFFLSVAAGPVKSVLSMAITITQ